MLSRTVERQQATPAHPGWRALPWCWCRCRAASTAQGTDPAATHLLQLHSDVHAAGARPRHPPPHRHVMLQAELAAAELNRLHGGRHQQRRPRGGVAVVAAPRRGRPGGSTLATRARRHALLGSTTAHTKRQHKLCQPARHRPARGDELRRPPPHSPVLIGHEACKGVQVLQHACNAHCVPGVLILHNRNGQEATCCSREGFVVLAARKRRSCRALQHAPM